MRAKVDLKKSGSGREKVFTVKMAGELLIVAYLATIILIVGAFLFLRSKPGLEQISAGIRIAYVEGVYMMWYTIEDVDQRRAAAPATRQEPKRREESKVHCLHQSFHIRYVL